MKVFGGVNVGIGAMVAIIPYLNNCLYEGKALSLANGKTVPMKCYWTAEAEIAVGVSLLVLGLVMIFSRGGETTRALSVLGGVLALFGVLLPTALIGVCSDMSASCNLVMRPAMILLGGTGMLSSVGALFVSQRRLRAEIAL